LRPVLLTVFTVALLALACSGDDSNGGSGGVPGIPTFTGAEPDSDFIHSETGASSGSWQTSEDVADVREYFARELPAGGQWEIVETREIADGVVIRVVDPEDPNSVGTIIIRREGDSTRIVKTVGRTDDDDSGDDDDDGADPGDVVVGALPAGYPADVPLPNDAQIISGSAPLVDGSQYYLVEFTTPVSPTDVIAFFNQALPAQGWQTGAAGTDPEGFALNFTRGEDSVLVTGGSAAEGTTASITIIIQG
jgi:hypothetical protein